MNDVYFYEAFAEERAALEALLGGDIKAGFSELTVQESAHLEPPARLLSIRTQSRISLDWATRLDGILTRSQGFDHLEKYFQETGTSAALGYLPPYCSTAVAEHAVAASLMLLRQFPRQQRQFEVFNRDHLTGIECGGLPAVVVGVGHIGREIVRLGRALGFAVRGVDLEPRETTLEYVSLEEGVASSRVIYCALPLTPQTRGRLGYDGLSRGITGKILVNISRGEITPLQDMARLLDEGWLAGLAMDVFDDERELAVALRTGKMDSDGVVRLAKALSRRDNVVFTPHNAFNTAQALRRKAELSVEAVRTFLSEERFPEQLIFDGESS